MKNTNKGGKATRKKIGEQKGRIQEDYIHKRAWCKLGGRRLKKEKRDF